MKKILFTLLLAALSVAGQAQIIKSNSVKVKVTEESITDGKTSWQYLGLGGGGMIEDAPILVEYNYLKTISGTFDYSVVPYFGGGAAVGWGMGDGNFYAHVQPFVGVMLGGPSLRFDMRVAPTLFVCDEAYLAIMFEPGVWIGHFYLGIAAGVEVGDGEGCALSRIGWSF